MIGLAIVGAAMLGKGGVKMGLPYRAPRFRALVGRAVVRACAVFPWLSSDVDAALQRAWGIGMRSPKDLTTHALMEVYPVTPEGDPVSWPFVPGDCASVRAIEERTHYRAKLIAAAQNDLAADSAWYESGGR